MKEKSIDTGKIQKVHIHSFNRSLRKKEPPPHTQNKERKKRRKEKKEKEKGRGEIKDTTENFS